MPEESPEPSRWKRILYRFIRLLVAAVIIGSLFHFIAREAHRLQPSGFKAGVLHGALMPLALPNLLVGDDVDIYARENTGRLYNLGYTMGVNGCGLLFFGFFFWRVGRWRRKKLVQLPSGESSTQTGSTAH
jgi:hypothetical protein